MKRRLLCACLLIGCAQAAEAPALPALGSPDASMNHLRKALARSTRDLRVERRSERLHIDMNGTFQTASVITFDAKGRPSKLCLDNPQQLDHMLGESP